MSNLVSHADRELKWAGYSRESEDLLDKMIYLSTMTVVEAFANCGHSGGSAEMHTQMIARLLRFEPLGPLTDNPDEWMEVSDYMGPGETGVWQNYRDGRMFSEDGGKTYYSVDEFNRGWKRRLFGRKGKIYTSEAAWA